MSKSLRLLALIANFVCLLCFVPSSASAFQNAERLTAPKLFPDNTLAYFRIADVRQLKKDLDGSSMGKLANDDQLKPIINEFYGTFVKSTEQIVSAIGLSIDEILAIPSGELAVALFAGGKGRAAVDRGEDDEGNQRVNVRVTAPIVALMIDAGEEISSVQVLLQRMDEAIGDQSEHLQKNVDRLVLHSYQNNDRADQQFAYFVDGGTLIACTNIAYIEDLAEVWLGRAGDRKTLADNTKFTSMMSRCVGTEGERPQVSFYADPLAMVREFTPKSAGSTMVLAMLPPLGLDGFEAIGGSWIVSPPDFDSISHLHVSLASPRRVILGLLRPKSGSVAPEAWVPSSAAVYMTVNWDIQATLQAVEQLYNRFRGENALQTQVFDQASKQVGFDVRKELVENLEGRLTMVQGFVRPITVNSGSNVYAIRLKNPKLMENNVLPKIIELVGRRQEVTTESFGKIKAHVMNVPGPGNRPNAPIQLRSPEICFAIVDDYLIIADSRYMMRQLADTLNDSSSQLSESLEFQLINDRIKAQIQEKQPSAISFARPEESLQLFYELARDSKNKDALKNFAGNNPVFAALNEALQKHELPPFSVISNYLVPSGGYLIEEELGLHYTSFSLKRE
jgi:hypothetical protein